MYCNNITRLIEGIVFILLAKFKENWKSFSSSKIEYAILVASLMLNFWTRRYIITKKPTAFNRSIYRP